MWIDIQVRVGVAFWHMLNWFSLPHYTCTSVFRVNLASLFTSYSGYIRLYSLQADSAIGGPRKVDGITLKVMVHKAAHLPEGYGTQGCSSSLHEEGEAPFLALKDLNDVSWLTILDHEMGRKALSHRSKVTANPVWLGFLSGIFQQKRKYGMLKASVCSKEGTSRCYSNLWPMVAMDYPGHYFAFLSEMLPPLQDENIMYPLSKKAKGTAIPWKGTLSVVLTTSSQFTNPHTHHT